jgi:hypothetical protein
MNCGEDARGETLMRRTPIGVARKLFQDEVKREVSEEVRGGVKEQARAVNWAHVAASERGAHVKQENVHNEGRIAVKEELEIKVDRARIAATERQHKPPNKEDQSERQCGMPVTIDLTCEKTV